MLAFFLFFDGNYLLLMLPLLALSMWASYRVKSTFKANNKTPIRSRYSGKDAAEAILRAGGIGDVRIREVPGMLSDHYNPMNKTVSLSSEVLRGRTPAAVAVAAHEVGHALQHAQGYRPMEWRGSIVPVVNIASNLALPMIIIGLFFLRSQTMAYVGVALFGAAVLFHLVTLPVEFDASARAIKILEQSGIVAPDEMPGVRKTLFAAGFTYVAAALVALVELVFWLLRAQSMGEE